MPAFGLHLAGLASILLAACSMPTTTLIPGAPSGSAARASPTAAETTRLPLAVVRC